MNDPKDVPINVEDEIEWLRRYRLESGMSWTAIARASGIPYGTISSLPSGAYTGNYEVQARRIMQFRQKIQSQAERSRSALKAPSFIETPTSLRIQFLLEVAHMGRITIAAMGPGTGKTITARHYAASAQPTYLATMRQSTKTVSAMIARVMDAMRLQSKSGWVQQRSNQIVAHTAGANALLIIDEANHLDWAALEELRGWHDEAGLGIALLGNEELITRIRGGARSHAYARLSSRIANSHEQDAPSDGDAEAFLDEYNIDDSLIRKRLLPVAVQPGHGGLREVKQILEAANMLAIADDMAVTVDHIDSAIASRATIQRRRAA